MSNNNDWEELKEWDEKRKKEEIEKYGLNISNMNINKKNKTMNRISKALNSINIITICLCIFLIIFIISMISTFFGNLEFKMSNYGVEKYIMEKYNLEITIFAKRREANKNYIIFQMHTNDDENIEFSVIKKYNNYTDDYVMQRHKYYFNLWTSLNEVKFTVKEKEEKGLLIKYEIYLEENTLDIIDFKNFCGNNFMNEWKIYNL